MTPTKKRNLILTFSTIIPIILLAVVWVVNGSETEDLWLYLTSVAVILSSTLGSYSQSKTDKEQ